MNNEALHFWQNRDVLKKLSRFKLYLPRLKETTNLTLIFFKIRVLYKKIIETLAVFIKKEIINEGNVNFLDSIEGFF